MLAVGIAQFFRSHSASLNQATISGELSNTQGSFKNYIQSEVSQVLRINPACYENVEQGSGGLPLLQTHDNRPLVGCDSIPVRGGMVPLFGQTASDLSNSTPSFSATSPQNIDSSSTDALRVLKVDSPESESTFTCRLVSRSYFQNPSTGNSEDFLVSTTDDPDCTNLEVGGLYVATQAFEVMGDVKSYSSFFQITAIEENFNLTTANSLAQDFDSCFDAFDNPDLNQDFSSITSIDYDDTNCSVPDPNGNTGFVNQILNGEGTNADEFLESLRRIRVSSSESAFNQLGGLTSTAFSVTPTWSGQARPVGPVQILPVKVIEFAWDNQHPITGQSESVGAIFMRQLRGDLNSFSGLQVDQDWTKVASQVEGFQLQPISTVSHGRDLNFSTSDIENNGLDDLRGFQTLIGFRSQNEVSDLQYDNPMTADEEQDGFVRQNGMFRIGIQSFN